MKNFVKVVAHPETKKVFTIEDGKEWGVVRVDSENIVASNGFFTKQRRTAFVRLTQEIFDELNLKDNQMLKGKIQRTESLIPGSSNHKPKVNPTTGELVTHNGEPIYLTNTYTEDLNAEDVLLGNDVQTVIEEEAVEEETVTV